MNSAFRIGFAAIILLFGVRVGFYGVRALFTATAIAAGQRRYRRGKNPVGYWTTIVAQLAICLAIVWATVLTYQNIRERPNKSPETNALHGQ